MAAWPQSSCLSRRYLCEPEESGIHSPSQSHHSFFTFSTAESSQAAVVSQADEEELDDESSESESEDVFGDEGSCVLS